MDHARKIGKSEVSFAWNSRPSPPTSIGERPSTTSATAAGERPLEEDRRLVNWKRWMRDRELHYRHLERCTGRDREELLMVRDVDEARRKFVVSEAAQGLDKFDRARSKHVRAGPGFWSSLGYLSKRGNPDLPDIVATPTKRQMKARPTLERITLPELIKREKGLPTESKPFKPFPRASNYLNEREKNISRRMKFLNCREKEMSQLAISGRRIREKPPKLIFTRTARLKATLENFQTESDEELDVFESNEDPDVVRMKIQDREISSAKSSGKINGENGFHDFTWWLVFESSVSRKCEREIRLENRCNFAITYHWRLVPSGSGYISSSSRDSPFFFNKNNGIVLPRQLVKLSIWFRSERARIATETWNFVTDPPISSETLTFRFWGSANFPPNFRMENSQENFTSGIKKIIESPDTIKKYIKERTRDMLIHDIIKSIIDSVGHQVDTPSVAYASLFLDRQIFCAKNPLHCYSPELMKKFQNIYDDATSEDSPSWNLSLKELRKILLTLKNSEVRNEKIAQFNDLCFQSFRPNFEDSKGQAERATIFDLKKRIVYNLFSTFANKFEGERRRAVSECFRRGVSIEKGMPSRDDSHQATSLRASKNPQSLDQARNTRASFSVTNDEYGGIALEKKLMDDSYLYLEVFHVRIRAILVETILSICAAIDTVNNFNTRTDKK